MMDLKEMTIDELLERRSAIAEEINAPEADLDGSLLGFCTLQ